MSTSDLFQFLETAVFLGWPSGSKGDATIKWGAMRFADMTAPYLATLDGGNIGIAHGDRSGGLCSVDCDNESFLADFVAANPALRETWQTAGVRGRNFHFRCSGMSPRTRVWKGRGELRSNGAQTIIAGIHPSGCLYTYPNGWVKPVILDPKALVMPDGKPVCKELHATHPTKTQRESMTDCVASAGRIYQLRPPPDWKTVWICDCYALHRGQSDSMLFKLAQKLKRFDPAMSDQQLAGHFAAWWNVSFSNVDPERPSEWYCTKLVTAYRRIDPTDPVGEAWRGVPVNAAPLERLARLGELLADADGRFYLDCRRAASLIGVHFTTANRWMHSIWLMTKRGRFKHDANEWQLPNP